MHPSTVPVGDLVWYNGRLEIPVEDSEELDRFFLCEAAQARIQRDPAAGPRVQTLIEARPASSGCSSMLTARRLQAYDRVIDDLSSGEAEGESQDGKGGSSLGEQYSSNPEISNEEDNVQLGVNEQEEAASKDDADASEAISGQATQRQAGKRTRQRQGVEVAQLGLPAYPAPSNLHQDLSGKEETARRLPQMLESNGALLPASIATIAKEQSPPHKKSRPARSSGPDQSALLEEDAQSPGEKLASAQARLLEFNETHSSSPEGAHHDQGRLASPTRGPDAESLATQMSSLVAEVEATVQDGEYICLQHRSTELQELEATLETRSNQLLGLIQPLTLLLTRLSQKRSPLQEHLKLVRRLQLAIGNCQTWILEGYSSRPREVAAIVSQMGELAGINLPSGIADIGREHDEGEVQAAEDVLREMQLEAESNFRESGGSFKKHGSSIFSSGMQRSYRS
ncbi:hypothetical protein WJX74_003080 [Apatococcus lobatus]|uniref:Uncharacterized protein n=1 Tax=Apatococcus lobatus TaxID=904363 RepID=A0AAW1RIZ9_9CHLO